MRVALFTNNYLPFCGGVTISVETLRQGLEARGHDAWVFAPRLGPLVEPSSRVVRYRSVPAATYPDFALAVPWSRRIARRVAALAPDVFHAHHPFLLGPAARRHARRLGRPLVFTYHTRYEKYAHYLPLPRRLVATAALRVSTRFAARADAVIAPSAEIRDELRARGVDGPIAVVPTGVDLQRFAPGNRVAARRSLGLSEGDAVVLYSGRLDPEKSVDLVLLAFDRIAAVVPGARLLLAGQGTQAARLRAVAGRLGAGPRTRFLGPLDHPRLAACYRAADVFLFASTTETQGLVLAEAAACGLPAVAVDAPGCSEVVRDGDTGILVKGDPTSLADAAIGLLLDPARRDVLARRARAVAEAEFGAPRMIERTLELYAEAIACVARRA